MKNRLISEVCALRASMRKTPGDFVGSEGELGFSGVLRLWVVGEGCLVSNS